MIYRGFMKLCSGVQYLLNREIYYQYKIKQLQSRGLKIGKDVYVAPRVEFDHNYPYLIEVQDHCRISADTLILAHDATTFRALDATRLGRVRILEGTFIGQRCIILPGCTIGPGALIAAGSVVNRDIGEGQCAAGNPARPYGKYADLIEKYRAELETAFLVDKERYLKGEISPQEIAEALAADRPAFMMGHPRTASWKDKILWWKEEYEWVGK